MKKIIKAATKEEAEYFSDFSGEKFHLDIPEVTVKISFDYGSMFDDSEIELYLTDAESKELLEFLKKKLCDNTKHFFKEKLLKNKMRYDLSVQDRNWDDCEYHHSNIQLCEYFLSEDKKS